MQGFSFDSDFNFNRIVRHGSRDATHLRLIRFVLIHEVPHEAEQFEHGFEIITRIWNEHLATSRKDNFPFSFPSRSRETRETRDDNVCCRREISAVSRSRNSRRIFAK